MGAVTVGGRTPRCVQLVADGGWDGFAWEEVRPRQKAEPPPQPGHPPSALLLPPLRPDEQRVTQDDLHFLSDVHDVTGFQCVELRVCDGGARYVGKAFKRPVGPRRTTARQAAADVAAFWRGLYGDRWRGYFAVRMRHPWRLKPDRGGYRVRVWVGGRVEYVGGGRKALGDVYPTPSAALSAYRRWVRSHFGLFAPIAGYYLRAPHPGRCDDRRGRRECRGVLVA